MSPFRSIAVGFVVAAAATTLAHLLSVRLGPEWIGLVAAAAAVRASWDAKLWRTTGGALAGVAGAVMVVALAGPIGTRLASRSPSLDGRGKAALAKLGVVPEHVQTRWRAFERVDRVVVRRGTEETWVLRDGAEPVPAAPAGFDLRALASTHPLLRAVEAVARDGPVAAAGSLPGGLTRAGLDTLAYEPQTLLLASTPVVRGGQPVATVGAGALSSRAAFRRAWDVVKPGGTLAWIASEEAVFARGVWVLAGLLTEDGAGPLPGRAWGLRLTDTAPEPSPYRWLLLLPKGPPSSTTAARLRRMTTQEASSQRPGSLGIVFGPGFEPSPRYQLLADPRGMEYVRRRAMIEFARRLGVVVQLDAKPAGAPDFLRLTSARSLSTRTVLGLGTAGILFVLLFPMPARRRHDADDAQLRPPVPLFLLLGGLFSWGATFVALASFRAAALESGRLGPDTAFLLIAAIPAFALPARLRARSADLGLAAGLGACAGLAAGAHVLSGGAPLRVSGVSVLAGATSVVAVAAVAIGLRRCLSLLGGSLDDLGIWTRRLAGLAVPSAVVAAEWVATDHGWAVTAFTGAGLFVVAGALGTWLFAQRIQRM